VTDEWGGAILGADPGVGKTLIALHALWLDGFLHKKGIICGPNPARSAWVGEHSDPAKHYDLNIIPLEGQAPNAEIFSLGNWFYIHYEILQNWHSWIFNQLRPEVMVFDESHYLANPNSQRSKSCRQLAKAAFTKRRLLLTGTPIPKYRMDLWAQLATAQPNQWAENRHSYGCRHCFIAGTRVTTEAFTLKPIEQIRVGDRVIGFEKKKSGRFGPAVATVLHIYRRWAPIWKVVLNDGTKIYQTRDHKWFVPKTRGARHNRLYAPLIPPEGKQGSSLKTLKQWNWGAEPLDIDEQFMLGWLRGVMEGDGCLLKVPASPFLIFKGHLTPTYRSYLAQKIPEHLCVIERAEAFAVALGWFTRRWFDKNSNMLHLTFKMRSKQKGRRRPVARPTYKFFSEDLQIHEHPKNFWRGWLSGMYDAEGHSNAVTQSEKINNITYNRLLQVAELLGFTLTITPRKKGDDTSMGIRLNGGQCAFKKFAGEIRPAKLAALLSWAPTSLRNNADDKGLKKVVSFEPTELFTEVFNIETSTGNYFVENLATKNCNGRREAPEEGYGEAHWVYDGQSNTDELRSRLAGVYLRFTKEEIADKLPKLERRTILLNREEIDLRQYWDAQLSVGKYSKEKETEQYIEVAGKKLLVPKAEDKKSGKHLMSITSLICELEMAKLKPAIDEVCKLTSQIDKLVVFCHQRKAAKEVVETLRALAKPNYPAEWVIGPITGDMPQKKREETARKFAQLSKGIAVCTRGSMAVAINELATAKVGLQVCPDWNPSGNLQCESRWHRKGNPNPVVESIYLIAPGTIDELFMKKLDAKAQESAAVSSVDTPGLNLVADLIPQGTVGKGDDVEGICAILAEMEDE
jgi:hypothetical protein